MGNTPSTEQNTSSIDSCPQDNPAFESQESPDPKLQELEKVLEPRPPTRRVL